MFRRILAALKAVSHAIGNVVARVVLTLFYFVIMPPFALITRLTSDPLRLKSQTPAWVEREPTVDDLAAAQQQH